MREWINSVFSEQELPLNFIRFYGIGLLLFIFPITRGLFISITSITLLLVFCTAFYFHKNWNLKTILWFLFIFISSFFLELAGTSTGKIFGEYFYGNALGWKIHGTPLIIGLNWLFLVYASHDIVSNYFSRPLIRIATGALLMLVYDVVVEIVAAPMDMWYFENSQPPLANYITWFIAAVIYHAGFEVFHIRSDNRPARTLFVIQIVFLMLVGGYNWIF